MMTFRLPKWVKNLQRKHFVALVTILIVGLLTLPQDNRIEVFTDAEEVALCFEGEGDALSVKATDPATKRVVFSGVKLKKGRFCLIGFPRDDTEPVTDRRENSESIIRVRALSISTRGQPIVTFSAEELLSRVTECKQAQAELSDDGGTLQFTVTGPKAYVILKGVQERALERRSFLATVLWRIGELALVIIPLALILFFLWSDRSRTEPDIRSTWLQTYRLYGPIVIVTLALSVAVMSERDRHPDEAAHCSAAEFYRINWMPPRPGSPRLHAHAFRPFYSKQGFFRGYRQTPIYLYTGKLFSLVDGRLSFHPTPLLRFTNLAMLVLLGLLLCFHREDRRILLFTLSIWILPQIWYLFSYCNDDASGLAASFLMWSMLIRPDSQISRYLKTGEYRGNWGGLVAFSTVTAFLLLSKTNFWITLLICGAYPPVMALVNVGPKKCLKTGLRLMIPAIAGLLLAVNWFFVFHHYPNRKEILSAEREANASPEYKKSTAPEDRFSGLNWRDQGKPLTDVALNRTWYKRSFQSLYGWYGYMKFASGSNYYWIAFALVLLFMAGGVYGHFRRHGKKAVWIILFALGSMVVNLAASIYFSWNGDFQPQGRYLLPGAIACFGVLAMGWEEVLDAGPPALRRYGDAFPMVAAILGVYHFVAYCLGNV